MATFLKTGYRTPLFSELLPVAVKLGALDYGERLLRIEIRRKRGQNLAPLEVQVVDDVDHCFMYSLKISEEDFLLMKKQQGLLVDFELFPEHLINLLDKCSDMLTNYQLVLVREDSTLPTARGAGSLQVIEVTNFMNLCYLTLLLMESTESDMKIHLRQQVLDLEILGILKKERAFMQRHTIDEMEKEFEEAALEAALKDKEIHRFKAKCEEEKCAIKMRAERELTDERERHSKVMWEYQQSAELEKKCLEDKYQDMIRQQEKQITSLKNQLQTSTDLQKKEEYSNRGYTKEIEVLEKEMKLSKSETANLKKQIFKLDSDYHDKEREVQTLRTRLAVVEQDLKDKNELLAELQETAKHQQEEKKHYEESIADKDKMLQKQKVSLETVSEDLLRANALLSFHQREVLSLKSKLKMSTNVAFEQEKLLEEHSKGLTEVQQLYAQSMSRVMELEQEVSKMRESLVKVEKAIEDKEKLLHEDQIVINGLNQRFRELYTQEPPQSLTHWSYKSRCPQKCVTSESASTPITTMSGSLPFSRPNPAQPSLGSRAPQAYLPVRVRGPLPQSFSRTSNAANFGTGSQNATAKSDKNGNAEEKKDTVMPEIKEKGVTDESKEKAKPEEKFYGKGPREASLPHVGILRVNPPPRPSAYFNPAGRK